MSDPTTELAAPEVGLADTHVMRFIAENGSTFDFTPHGGGRFDVEPLNFEQFVKAAESKAPSFPVVITNANAAAAVTGLDVDGPLAVTAVMGGNGPVLAYGLVEGGWLPMPWAHKRTAFLDRNVVLTLEAIQRSRERASGPHARADLTKWLGLDVDTVSPALFALEGKDQRPPSEFEIRAELGRAARALAHTLPGAKVHAIGTAQRHALYRMHAEHAAFRVRATRLLLRAVPLVVNREKPEQRLRLEQTVLQVARDEGVRADSLVVLALLSCVYDANPELSTHRAATPGRAVLKPKTDFNKKDAYNAIADLFALELLHNAHALFPSVKPVLYTQDVGMAALWTATQPCTTEVTHGANGKVRTTVSFALGGGLFPALAHAEVATLRTRLQM